MVKYRKKQVGDSLSHKDLFTISPEGYDIAETDAYIAFLLSEYNSTLEKNAGLQKALEGQAADAIPGAEEALMKLEGSLEEARQSNEQLQQEIDGLQNLVQQTQEQVDTLREERRVLQEANSVLTDKVYQMTQETQSLQLQLQQAQEEAEQLRQADSTGKPTLEHTSQIIAQTIIEIQESADRIKSEAVKEAQLIIDAAQTQAQEIEEENKQRAKRADEFFKESQRRMQEAYQFITQFENTPDSAEEGEADTPGT